MGHELFHADRYTDGRTDIETDTIKLLFEFRNFFLMRLKMVGCDERYRGSEHGDVAGCCESGNELSGFV